MNDDLNHFISHWLAGLFTGLECIGASSRETLLRACARGCAASYTTRVFREVYRESADTDAFLAGLAARFPEARYERVGSNAIRVRYIRCGCDWVTNGLTRSPRLCDCSRYNLEANFEGALEMPVTVIREASILEGEAECSFLVTPTGLI
ncbi:MAG TPA: hypothetical protein GX702_01335 [Chloroflexi bacterium]|jgi:hypothetical protein|nr:hypothetical protein [Chloroflexota bacterium]